MDDDADRREEQDAIAWELYGDKRESGLTSDT